MGEMGEMVMGEMVMVMVMVMVVEMENLVSATSCTDSPSRAGS